MKRKKRFSGKTELKAYEKMKDKLEREYFGQFVVLRDKKIIAKGKTLDIALKKAERKYPNKVFFVKKVGSYPASVMIF